MHRDTPNFICINVDHLRTFRNFKCTKNVLYDPPYRFTDAYLSVVQQFPSNWPQFDSKSPSAILLCFSEDDELECHGFIIHSKKVEHYEIGSNRNISTSVISWLCVDILKRLNCTRTVDAVECVSLAPKDKMSSDEKRLLIDLFLFYRLRKRTAVKILAKLKEVTISKMLCRYDKKPLGCWRYK